MFKEYYIEKELFQLDKLDKILKKISDMKQAAES